MTKVRQDAWSHEDDLLLAETVLRHIREGSTQLVAFEEVGDKLNRTGAACGFRWNAIVRRKYEQAIEIAKKQRKQRKRAEQQERSQTWQTASAKPFIHPESAGGGHDTLEHDEMNDAVMPMYEEAVNDSRPLTMNAVIHFLENLQMNDRSSQRLAKENNLLQEQNKHLEAKVTELEKQLEKLEEKHHTIEEDYQSLISIMDRARRMVIFQDQEESASPAFKMDKNGNLEKIAK
ncbi:prespore-specific regulator [Scopulibacillus darangshiensis]|uniref:Prespore-specific regulator n=1 Tax=Scopulibacillus darangshiensis TaxID=442528 RepID=A0A4R2PEC3_9BACL|nr:RsfA family transcriptional regulator [Scopulibacillus darangshiensis]TCP32275.1 prespore-specific regulator [Scopulibacillus darangshiensis]